MLEVGIGSPVIFVDQEGRQLHALVLTTFAHAVEGPDEKVAWEEGTQGPTVNLVFADPEPALSDSYGRQIKRETSIPHRSGSTAPGFWWKLPEEE